MTTRKFTIIHTDAEGEVNIEEMEVMRSMDEIVQCTKDNLDSGMPFPWDHVTMWSKPNLVVLVHDHDDGFTCHTTIVAN